MTSNNLKNRIYQLYGNPVGDLLYPLMNKIQNLGFCVASGWDEREISIALRCDTTGQLFKISKDYKSIISPDITIIPVKKSSYSDIAYHLFLPRLPYHKRKRHCSIDDAIRVEFDK